VKLSICIPTYNFGEFIGETLESILPQVSDGVEVVVLDGGSTDATPQVVESFQARYPGLRYVRQAQRGGIDRDLARTIDEARGEYCWLFCSDDVMKPGAVAQILGHIESGHDVYVCGFTLATPDLRPIRDEPILNSDTDAEFDLGVPDERRAYFTLAERTPAFFSFAGSLTLRKERWDSVPLNEEFVGSCWAHVARLFEIAPGGLRLKYLAQPYLYKRTENDSFMDAGIIRRYALAIDGYHRLARTFFDEDSDEARAIRRVVRNEFPPWILLEARSQGERDGRSEDVPLLDRLARTTYADPGLRNRIYLLLYRRMPLRAYRAALALYRFIRRVARFGRRS